MIRNKEIRYLAAGCLALGALGTAAGFWITPLAGVLALCLSLGFSALLFLFTAWRYREIARLSSYLAGVYTGGQTLDIRDNAEGELSILKNDLYKLTLTLSEQAELLKKDKRALSNALSDISHQLRTPLTSLFVMTDLMREQELPKEKHEEFLDRIASQLERIQWLVSSLLKLSRIDAGAVEFKREQIGVGTLIDRALAPLLIPAELRGVALSVSCGEGLSVVADESWTAEALTNVVKNCIEHTPEGGNIRVEASENPLHIAIAVTDTGCGIDREDLPHLFERFYRGKNAGDESVGIGLAMAKSILQQQNADIFVRSEIGQGSRFTLRFYKQVV